MSFFETRMAFRQFWVREPRHSEKKNAAMCYLYLRTCPNSPVSVDPGVVEAGLVQFSRRVTDKKYSADGQKDRQARQTDN